MKPCTRVGLDVTWRCNWSCQHCFYRHDDRLHTAVDVPLAELVAKLQVAKAGGIDHAVLVGFGEPTLYPQLYPLLEVVRDLGLASSMITNGTAARREVYENCFDLGLDHVHLSSHGSELDAITQRPGSRARQLGLKDWLTAEGHPWRSNIAIQQLNYRHLADDVEEDFYRGSRHLVLLGFLPHYDWGRDGRARDVAVHPAELRPSLEDAADTLLDLRATFTIRYHPFCHLAPRFWKYVVNARYVYFDPWEWNYELQAHDAAALWEASKQLGDSVANATPCHACAAYNHCGGWNRFYAAAFDGAGLQPILEVPDEYRDVWDRDGGLHDLNPANSSTGTFGRCSTS